MFCPFASPPVMTSSVPQKLEPPFLPLCACGTGQPGWAEGDPVEASGFAIQVVQAPRVVATPCCAQCGPDGMAAPCLNFLKLVLVLLLAAPLTHCPALPEPPSTSLLVALLPGSEPQCLFPCLLNLVQGVTHQKYPPGPNNRNYALHTQLLRWFSSQNLLLEADCPSGHLG